MIENKHILKIDNNKYVIPISDYYEFLSLDDNSYNKAICLKYYKNIPIEYFIYGLVNYFSKRPINLNQLMLNRYINLKEYNIIDFESVNQLLKTNDKRLSKVRISNDIKDIISYKYDDNVLKNIIKVYIELCKLFIYDDLYYIDDFCDEVKNITNIHSLVNIDKKNNKVVCFQFTEIFGYFLNTLNIPYEIVGKQTFYGFAHTYIKFRFNKFIITINPIRSIYNSDYTNVKVGNNLIGIDCINKNINTKVEFYKILSSCYNKKELNYDDYLPYNKIENDIEIKGVLKDYIQKIDFIFKKIKELNLEVIDKITYFNYLMHTIFDNNSINNNIGYSLITNYLDIVYVIVINEINIKRENSIYLMYYKNKLLFIDKDELIKLFESSKFKYLDKRHLPNINYK